MSKRSRTMWHGIPIVITEKSGIRWGKSPSRFNRCIGGALRGKSYSGAPGEVKRAIVAAFKGAVSGCLRK